MTVRIVVIDQNNQWSLFTGKASTIRFAIADAARTAEHYLGNRGYTIKAVYEARRA